jgi:NAD(P)-dependent dehydrogenase (short-subunit alcohol dehydrogenase family)
MDLQLKQKIALVTGSTAGIGNAIAASLVTYVARPLSAATNGAPDRLPLSIAACNSAAAARMAGGVPPPA